MIETDIFCRDNLKKLMEFHRIGDSELSEKTKIPALTIYRIKTGYNSDPKVSILRKLAKYFDITIDQLIDNEPLLLAPSPTSTNKKQTFKVPILSWKQVFNFDEIIASITEKTHTHWLYTDQVSSRESFALKIESDYYGTLFPQGSIVLIDYAASKENACHFFVLDKQAKEGSIVKIVKMMSERYMIHPVNPAVCIKLDAKIHSIIGVVAGVTTYLLK